MECFSSDPLYCSLIPDQETRKRLLPELFQCDLTEFFETCEIYAESPSMNALLVVSDESEPYNPLIFYLTEAWASLRTDEYLIKEDPSLKTLWNFVKGRDYLNSRWTDQLHQEERLHVIYLAVRPSMQHHGLAALLMEEVIAEALQHISRHRRGHSVRHLECPQIVLVRIDSQLMMQVIINLVNNAIQYTPAGSEIVVRSFLDGPDLVVEVADNGPGVPDAMKERIFDLFYTSRCRIADSRRGMGLGLALCQSIVSAHGQTLRVRDNIPQGAVFSFRCRAEEVCAYE